ncbi:MAG: CehA/McbA family metallohydrolase [Chloroflexi bacterium]|nr:CehA/McbA family metallohydrolase [Chloroflexota bacterium]
MMKLDLHVHTNWGSSDSGLSPQDLVRQAKEVGLDGVCVTEHGTVWDRYQLERFAKEHDFVIIPGMEVATDLGHITTFGLEGYAAGIHRAQTLRRALNAVDGFMIAAHPFRRMFDNPKVSGWPKIHSLEEAAELPIFSLVDEMEVVNGANNRRENLFALAVAKRLGKTGVGGSDSHSTNGLGAGGIVLERRVIDVQGFIEEMRAGRYYPCGSFLRGEEIPFWDDDLYGNPTELST